MNYLSQIQVNNISIVGSGPGNPELLTLRAARALELAEVVLYDDLSQTSVLALAPKNALLVDVGKRFNDGVDQDERQQTIHHLWLTYYNQKKRIVRLKGGDPMVFGKVYEELTFLTQNHIEYEIIPGITAGLSAAALFSIPLTIRDKAQGFMVTTAQKIKSQQTQLSGYAPLLAQGHPLIIYMGGTQLASLAKQLLELNISEQLYINVLSNVSMPTQQQQLFQLHQFKQADFMPEIALPAVVILGLYAKPFNYA